jgi:hypothetical protein
MERKNILIFGTCKFVSLTNRKDRRRAEIKKPPRGKGSDREEWNCERQTRFLGRPKSREEPTGRGASSRRNNRRPWLESFESRKF